MAMETRSSMSEKAGRVLEWVGLVVILLLIEEGLGCEAFSLSFSGGGDAWGAVFINWCTGGDGCGLHGALIDDPSPAA